MTDLADKNRETVVPNYTNGVAAQPNSLAHYLLAFLAGFSRDAQKLRQFYVRLDRCPMGSTVLNGTCWPLDREAMCKRLGFEAVAENAYDATQIGQSDLPVEFASILTGICLHINVFLEDLMVQYAQARPWILLQEGGDNTYVSSAMPQKRNPGLVNNCRTESSSVIGEAQAELFRAHNLQSGMIDPKNQTLNGALALHAVKVLTMFNRVLKALVINKDRALEELNSDWTASQEVADRLMKEYGVPFRIGHHAASHIVSYARANNILPLDFPYAKMQEIYKEVIDKDNMVLRSKITVAHTNRIIAVLCKRVNHRGNHTLHSLRLLFLHKYNRKIGQITYHDGRRDARSLNSNNLVVLDILEKAHEFLS